MVMDKDTKKAVKRSHDNSECDYSNTEQPVTTLTKIKKLSVETALDENEYKFIFNDINSPINSNVVKDLESSFGWFYADKEYGDKVELESEVKESEDVIFTPIESGDNTRIREMSAESAAELIINGDYKYQFIDARFPYEYEGGHIRGSINLFTPLQAITHMFPSATNPGDERHFRDTTLTSGHAETTSTLLAHVVDAVLTAKRDPAPFLTTFIFYCEFSSCRAPGLAHCVRNLDRLININHYPRLSVPNMCVLAGGYSGFYPEYKELCSPRGYVAMAVERLSETFEYLKEGGNDDKMKETEEEVIERAHKKEKYARCAKETKEQNATWAKIYSAKFCLPHTR